MRLTRRFTAALGQNIGPDLDIPAPDVGTNAQTMAWMADTYINTAGTGARLSGQSVVTGKPLEFGGSHRHEKATGQGVLYVLEELLPELGLDLASARFSIVGFGNVGSWTARLLAKRGDSCRAVLDHSGAIAHARGLDPEQLAQHVAQTGGVAGFPGGEPISHDDFYRLPVDLFIPAALEQMVDESIALRLSCRVVVEAANAPTIPAAERILRDRGIAILPAILCNCGGVTVSYFEWKQNRAHETWEPQIVDAALRQTLFAAAQRVKLAAHRYECDLRTAAYCVALDHLGKVYRVRGIFP